MQAIDKGNNSMDENYIKGGIVAALLSVIGALWKMHISKINKEDERLKNCERLHEESNQLVITLTGDYRELKGRVEAVENLSKAVLEKLEAQRKD